MARRRKARLLTASPTKTAAFDGGTTTTTLCLAAVGGGKGKGEVKDEEKMAALRSGVPGKSGGEVVRRNKMKEMFTALQSFVPNLPPKIAKAELTEETVNYIKLLEKECQALENKKHALSTKYTHPNQISPYISPEHNISREAYLADQIINPPSKTSIEKSSQNNPCLFMQTSESPNVVLSIAGFDAHVSVCAPKIFGLVSATVHFLEKYGAEVLSLQICSDMSRTMFVIHAHILELDGSMTAEERFELAKKELILWLAGAQQTSIPGNC